MEDVVHVCWQDGKCEETGKNVYEILMSMFLTLAWFGYFNAF